MIRLAAALCLVLAFGGGARAEGRWENGRLALATHRAGRTFVYITSLAELDAGVRHRLLASTLPELLTAADGAPTRTVTGFLEPLGTPFATWSGRRLTGFHAGRAVCTKFLRRLVLLGAVEGKAAPSPEAMKAALARGVVAGEVDDLEGACRTAEVFHDPDQGQLWIAPAVGVEDAPGPDRDEIYGGIGRLRLQPDWVAAQKAFLAARAKHPDAGTAPVSWDGEGARGVHFKLGTSPYVAAASASPDCRTHLALLFHAMIKPIPFWPSLRFESPTGALPDWVADVGEAWPVIGLNGELLAPAGDHYQVAQAFPGTRAPTCHAP